MGLRSIHARSCHPARAALARGLAAVILFVGGCAPSQWVTVRDTPRNPLAGTLDLVSPGGPKPTPRTQQLVRRYNLPTGMGSDRAELLAQFAEIQRREPNREHEYAMAELAYIAAAQAEKLNREKALEFYGTSLIHAYRYLFDYEGELPLNPYDPQFRGASDLYNQSLESLLRIVLREGELRPGAQGTIVTANHECSFDVVVHSSGWRDSDVDRFEFVNDYKVNGLKNHYHTYGLGVPLIAVRKHAETTNPAERFYPPNVCFPVTAFLRVERAQEELRKHGTGAGAESGGAVGAASAAGRDSAAAPHFVLELYDTLDRQAVDVAGRSVPLEADLSTPLAYFLSQPQFQDAELSTLGLLKPGEARELQGLYMLEPFDPDKMPVVMVHGLWSSPITWMEMYNDLRSDPAVRANYQFWFYFYPTGQPFWFSAAQMREDLASMRREVDPAREHPALDQTVLVGHSMGGLVSKLQSVESEDDFWHTMSDRSFRELDADDETVRSLAGTYYFRPSPSVRRVVTLGTPHRGSPFSNGLTRWLGHKLISLPSKMLHGRDELIARNRDYFRDNAPLNIRTSIDSLSPNSPVLPVLLSARPAPWVSFHNVVGLDPEPGWQKYIVGEGDGVVALASAQLDEMRQLRSQVIVPADHSGVHRHPQSVLEVRRILLEQLAELQTFPYHDNSRVAQAAAITPLPPVAQTDVEKR
jgi:pimeloyl-ACP methyl ester carboxylesterase